MWVRSLSWMESKPLSLERSKVIHGEGQDVKEAHVA